MTGGRCGAELSRSATESVCPACHASAKHEAPSIQTSRLAPAVWMWSAPETSAAVKNLDLATILRVYRRLNPISQERLAALLGYDKTYVPEGGPGWETTASIVTEMSENDREGLLWLLDTDPFFTLWLGDRTGKGIAVEMSSPDQSGQARFREVLATEYDGGAQPVRRF